MAAHLESYDSGKHDEHTVAQLIFQSDPVFNTLVYGKNAVAAVERLIRLGDNYFDSRYTRCAIHEASLVGVIVGFPISEKTEIDRKSGKDFARAMGFFRFLARIPLFVRMDKMMPAAEDENGYYIHTISVDSEQRGRGFGSEMIEQIASEHGALYLHVNRDNEEAIRFYERNGFKRLAEGSMMHKGRELSQVLMSRG
ncbi:MAG: GNAT family N-acetyltransferase [Spirochaetales bacterium]|nr:GNAT family N-acetyltransferase [Spirochaetales bacterium]MCF7939560.1 GNAT family N-acetyltransferase [Spirochaetales bacterium]